MPAGPEPPASAGPLPGGTAGPDESHRWTLPWDIFFAVVLVAVLVIIAFTDEPVSNRVFACAALLLAAVLYVAVGRPAVICEDRTGRGTVYLVLLVALVVVAQSFAAVSSFILFAACPQCFMVAPLRRAITGVVVLNLAPLVLLAGHHNSPLALTGIMGAVIGLAFSVAFGSWITRVIEQSHERAELIERLQAAQAELAEVSRQAGTLAERQRLAGEIHDTLAQGLTSIVMLLQAADTEIGSDPQEARRHVGLATQTAREGLAEARAMVAALTPTHLEAAPLHEALRRLTDRIGAELAIGARFEVRGPERPLPARAEVVLLRAGQEALANVRKHAQACDISVVLSYDKQAVRLDVCDDGAGFDPDCVSGGYGLRGMRSRILQVGGNLLVRARPGAGTSLSVEVPG